MNFKWKSLAFSLIFILISDNLKAQVILSELLPVTNFVTGQYKKQDENSSRKSRKRCKKTASNPETEMAAEIVEPFFKIPNSNLKQIMTVWFLYLAFSLFNK